MGTDAQGKYNGALPGDSSEEEVERHTVAYVQQHEGRQYCEHREHGSIMLPSSTEAGGCDDWKVSVSEQGEYLESASGLVKPVWVTKMFHRAKKTQAAGTSGGGNNRAANKAGIYWVWARTHACDHDWHELAK